MRYFFIFFLLLPGFFQGATLEQLPFSVEANVSSTTIAINQELTLQLILKYPSTFHPNLTLMQKRLLTYGGLYEPPFTLTQEIIYPLEEVHKVVTQKVEFLLSPQNSGRHFLTTGLIQFDLNSHEGKPVEIASDVFAIDVIIPKRDFDLSSFIQSPMGLSEQLSVSISQANKRAYLKNFALREEEQRRDSLLFEKKVFPWFSVFAGVVVILVTSLIRLLPENPFQKEALIDTKQKAEEEIKRELEQLASNFFKASENANAKVISLDFLLRRYLFNKYEFQAFSLTTQELICKINLIEDLTAPIKEGLGKTFKKADQIKFSNYSLTPVDFQDLQEIVKRFSVFFQNQDEKK